MMEEPTEEIQQQPTNVNESREVKFAHLDYLAHDQFGKRKGDYCWTFDRETTTTTAHNVNDSVSGQLLFENALKSLSEMWRYTS